MKIILGIDPGSKITGYAFIKIDNSNKIYHLYSGFILLKEFDIFKRIKKIYFEIDSLIKMYNPNYSVIEKIFIGKNKNSFIKLNYAKSAAILALINNDIPIFEYTYSQVIKYLLKNNINKNKSEINNIIINLLNISSDLKQDVFDAISMIIIHLYKSNNINLI